MMRIFFSVGLFCLFALAMGCKKTETAPEPELANEPVFHFQGNVDGKSVKMVAGINDYYMYTSSKLNNNLVYSFIGNLKQINCADCNSISFQINDTRATTISDSSNIDSLYTGNYFYEKDTVFSTVQYDYSFIAGDFPSTHYWDFGDGTSSTLAKPTHTYAGSGTYLIRLTVGFANGCTSNQYRYVTSDANACKARMLNTYLGPDTIRFSAITTGDVVDYYWNFGDSTSSDNTSTLKEPTHFFSKPGLYNVELRTRTADSCTNIINKKFNTGGFLFDCLIQNIGCVYPVDYYFSKITITYTDASGVRYYSNKITQPADSFFEILSIGDYLLNENGRPTKKIYARFQCTLSNGSKSVTINEGYAIFAVSY
jgi:PKD repeat protein